MQVGAGDRAAKVPDARRCGWQWCTERNRNGNYKHGRYTAEVAAMRRWLREAAHILRDVNERPE
jgi:hypothetical protein